MELKEALLERNGLNIHYWTGGKAAAPPVIFTHGATIDHHEWDATLPKVGEHFRLLTWDMRGHGLSRPASFSLKHAVDDLLTILDQLQVQQAIFVGHSLGGNLHQELVFQHPKLVRAMVFLDCTWNFQKLSALEAFSLSIAEPIFRIYPYKMLVSQSLALTATSKAAQELLRPAMESLSKDEFIHILMESAACLHHEPDYRINKPLLLMVGDKDATGNIRRIMPLWAEREPNCRFIVIPNAKHAANLDNPDFFHQTLMDFLIGRCQ
ncbi:MAG TPA: alpha/beta hydrolase [Cyanobacteria bacterium UBA11372]|nr:alpha/beta hydrolase [Cyanobacteria bacterium UBA11372]